MAIFHSRQWTLRESRPNLAPRVPISFFRFGREMPEFAIAALAKGVRSCEPFLGRPRDATARSLAATVASLATSEMNSCTLAHHSAFQVRGRAGDAWRVASAHIATWTGDAILATRPLRRLFAAANK